MSRPYAGFTPATDATPRDSDLDPHAGCREREAALRRALAAADAMADWTVRRTRVPSRGGRCNTHAECRVCGRGWWTMDKPVHGPDCPVAAYQAARKEVTP